MPKRSNGEVSSNLKKKQHSGAEQPDEPRFYSRKKRGEPVSEDNMLREERLTMAELGRPTEPSQ
jgi:hypothetical protein